MKITIIGVLPITTTYKEWEQKLLCAVPIGSISEILFTGGLNRLNFFIKVFAASHNISTTEYKTDPTAYGEKTKLVRNQQMINDCDKIIAFVTADTIEKTSESDDHKNESVILNKPAIVITIASTLPQTKMDKGIIHRNKQNFHLEEVTEDEIIPIEEECVIVKKFQDGGKDALSALDKLIHCNSLFVKSIAKQYTDHSLSLNELIAEGNKGIVAAAKKFDASRGFKFISYAVWFIKTSIENSILETIRTKHFSGKNKQDSTIK